MERKLMAVIMGMGLMLGMGTSIQSAVAADPVPTLDERVKALEEKASSISISGFVDVYYSINPDHPTKVNSPFGGVAGEQALRAFDIKANQFSLSQAKLVLQKAASPVGFRVDLSFGPTADLVNAFEPGNTEIYKMLQQAYVTYVAPVGKGLTIDLGKFVTPIGFEVIESKDNWNYSRGILFTWAIPFYHAGLRVSMPITDGLTVTLLGVNGWNNVEDNNSAKSVGASVAVTMIPKVTLIQNAMWGSESANNFRRDVYDTVLIVAPTEKLSLGLNFDIGMDDNQALAATAGDSSWYGLAGYGRFAFTDATALALRGEWFKDTDGYTIGAFIPTPAPITVAEATVTGEWKIGGALLTRLEYRHDWANKDFWAPNGTNPKSSQDTITLGAVYSF